MVARDTTTTLFAALNVLTGVAIGRCPATQTLQVPNKSPICPVGTAQLTLSTGWFDPWVPHNLHVPDSDRMPNRRRSERSGSGPSSKLKLRLSFLEKHDPGFRFDAFASPAELAGWQPTTCARPRPVGVPSSVEQAALSACVAELFVCPPSDGRVWIVVSQRLHEIVPAVGEQPF